MNQKNETFTHVLHYTVLHQLYVHDTYIPVNNQKLSKHEHMSQSTQIETIHFLGVHVQPEQRMNTFEVP